MKSIVKPVARRGDFGSQNMDEQPRKEKRELIISRSRDVELRKICQIAKNEWATNNWDTIKIECNGGQEASVVKSYMETYYSDVVFTLKNVE